MRFFSNTQSAENKVVSALSILEIVVCLALYFYVLSRNGWELFLLSGILITPILLLNSKKSAEVSSEWLQTRKIYDTSALFTFTSFFIEAALLLCISYAFFDLSNTYHDGLFTISSLMIGMLPVSITLFFCGLVFNVYPGLKIQQYWPSIATVILIAIQQENINYAPILFSIMWIAVLELFTLLPTRGKLRGVLRGPKVFHFALGVYFSAILVRLFTCLVFFKDGFKTLQDNWYRQMFCIDLLHAPSIIPRYHELSIERAIDEIRDENAKNAFPLFMIPLIYLPSTLYRLILKSTIWFYWPLIYLSKPPTSTTRNKDLFVSYIAAGVIERFRRFMAILTLISIFFASVDFVTVININQTDPLFILPYIFAIDIHLIKPWQYLQIGIVACTMIMWVVSVNMLIRNHVLLSRGEVKKFDEFRLLVYISKIRNIFTISFLVLVVVFTCFYWPGFDLLIPDNVLDLLINIYGIRFPIVLP